MSGVFQNIDPPPPYHPASVNPPAFGAGGGHTCWVERGFNILEDARHSSVLYICKYLVDCLDNLKIKDDSAKWYAVIRACSCLCEFLAWNQACLKKMIFCARSCTLPQKKEYFTDLSPYLWTFKEPRNRFQGIDSKESVQGIDSANLCSLGGRYVKKCFRTRSARLGIDSWAPLKVYKFGLWVRKSINQTSPFLHTGWRVLCFVLSKKLDTRLVLEEVRFSKKCRDLDTG
jgi:hypothetical protein